MKNLLMILLVIILPNISMATDHIVVTPTEYEQIDIPEWMIGPIWIKFQYESCNYTAVHVFTDDYHDPYIKLSQEGAKDILEFRKVAEILSQIWHDPNPKIAPANNFSQIINLPKSQHWENDNGESSLNALDFSIKKLTELQESNKLSIKIYFKGDLPDWAKKGLPFSVKN